jgi:hypothetical protein
MKFEDIKDLMKKPEPKADTYEAGMAQNQLLKIGTHAIKIHNMLDNDAEMESWVAKKIDLASNYVKSVHGYTAGSEAGAYDDDGMSEISKMPKGTGTMQGVKEDSMTSADVDRINKQRYSDKEVSMAKGVAFDKRNKDNVTKATSTIEKVRKGLSQQPDVADALRTANEDAGEGHMSKSQLYATAKMAIELIDMINKGDDLEGWVQTKLNLAADYLQAVYHYEDYQKLNPYREDLDGQLMQKHAGVIQKNLDEILARETKTADVDTKPGMMRILKKRVNEVEKEIAKENRKNTDEGGMPSSVIKSKQKYANMTDKELADRFKGADEKTLRQMAWRHGYGNMSSHYLDRVKNVMTSKRTGTTEAELEEGLKDWAKKTAAAGIIIAGLAGFNSINNAIDNSVPAIKAMNSALEMAIDQNDDELAKLIKKDLSDAKLRLDIGKDLSYVKGLQDKYIKFMPTEGLAYESKLAVQLNQQLK